jgi:hypothetical protein
MLLRFATSAEEWIGRWKTAVIAAGYPVAAESTTGADEREKSWASKKDLAA